MATKTARFEVRLTAEEDKIVRTKASELKVDRSEFAKMCMLNSHLINAVKPPQTLAVELKIIEGLKILSKAQKNNCVNAVIRKYEKLNKGE